jgi:hypothetical protein
MIYLFEAELWLWDARLNDSWTFLSLPPDASEEIREIAGPTPRGFGSVRVTVTIGGTSWATSIFPDAKAGVYVLPIKKAVRTAERVESGDTATVRIELRDV